MMQSQSAPTGRMGRLVPPGPAAAARAARATLVCVLVCLLSGLIPGSALYLATPEVTPSRVIPPVPADHAG